MTTYLAHITISTSPEEVKHAQHVIDQWTKFNPLEIEIKEKV